MSGWIPSVDSFMLGKDLRRHGKHLSEDGVLAVWSCAKDSSFADALRDVF